MHAVAAEKRFGHGVPSADVEGVVVRFPSPFHQSQELASLNFHGDGRIEVMTLHHIRHIINQLPAGSEFFSLLSEVESVHAVNNFDILAHHGLFPFWFGGCPSLSLFIV